MPVSKSFKSNRIFATIVAVFAFFNRLEQDVRHVPLHQNSCRLLEVLEGDDVVVAHVEGVGVALGHLLLELIVREAKQLEEAG